jgi:hypothetical protein
MAINVIVIAVTLMMGGFVAVWIVYPACRSWFEAPKWQPLRWDQPRQGPDEHCGPEAQALHGETSRLGH